MWFLPRAFKPTPLSGFTFAYALREREASATARVGFTQVLNYFAGGDRALFRNADIRAYLEETMKSF